MNVIPPPRLTDDEVDTCAQVGYEAWRAVGHRVYNRVLTSHGALDAKDRFQLRVKVRWALSTNPKTSDKIADRLFVAVVRATANSICELRAAASAPVVEPPPATA